MKTAHEVVADIYGEKDVGAVSKERLIHAVAKQSELIKYLAMELFCENRHHRFFNNFTREEKKPYDDERIRRRVFAEPVTAMKWPKAEGRTQNTKRI
jgi:hypothetical protein